MCLALKVGETWDFKKESIGSDTKGFVDIVVDVIQHFPKQGNPFRDIMVSL